ncbi:MAG: ComF family protein [Lachnospiraceae bacterium]|nr:ComF family protein [Lachnospiraceae bacterium]
MKVKSIFRVLESIYPRRCPGCDRVISGNKTFCEKCKDDIVYVGENFCMKCGKRMWEDNINEFCGDCRRRKRSFDEGRGVYVYRGPMKMAMYRFKYSNRRCYARTFAGETVRCLGKWRGLKDIDGIIPVPMYRNKMKGRGYNQAEVIAEALGKMLRVPVYNDFVVRGRETAPQKNLDDEGRRHNLKNAFIIKQNSVKLNRILIIDDIFTTGSTMEEISRVCRKAGVSEIYCLCICTGQEV